MGKFKAGDLVKCPNCNNCDHHRVIAVDDEVGELWLRGTKDKRNRCARADDCTLYVPPPEVGRRYKGNTVSSYAGTLEAIKIRRGEKIGVIWDGEHFWQYALADLIPAEAP